LYLDYLETTQALRYIVTPGQSDPWYCTALGRAAAAQLSDKALSRLISETRLRPITPATIRTRANLHREVERVRAEGYAHEVEESVEGVCCLAVGLAPMGFPEAAISVALPIKRLTSRRKAAILKTFSTLITT
jgi:IclR family acetate operon transcriptional repressor/IclR family KDG regulon transcriptional repressor